MSAIQYIGQPKQVGKFLVKRGYSLVGKNDEMAWVTVVSQQSGKAVDIYAMDDVAAGELATKLVEVLGS